MIKDSEIIFLIRSYNEGNHLLTTIDKIQQAGYKNILVVDDGSKDNTKKELQDRKDIFYIRHFINLGAGAALETGFAFLRTNGEKLGIKYVVSFDADGQHKIEDLPRFKKAFEEDKNLDLVLGSRFIDNTVYNIPFHRKFILFLAKFFTLFISKIVVSDPHNGYKMFRLETIKKIKLNMENFAYASELIDKIAQNNLKFTEVPVNILYTDYSLSKGQKTGNAINIAIKMVWTKLFK